MSEGEGEPAAIEWQSSLPDPEQEAFGALVSTICSNCIAQGTTSKEDIQKVLKRYGDKYPQLTADMIQGGIFTAKRLGNAAGSPSKAGEGSPDAGGMPGMKRLLEAEEAVAAALGGGKNSPKKKKRKAAGEKRAATTIAISAAVSRADVNSLLDLRFDDDDKLTRIEWSPTKDRSNARFIKARFQSQIPAEFSIKGGGTKIFQIGAPSGKLVGMRGGREKTHNFSVYFHGKCLAEKDGCPTRWQAGFEREQLELLSDEECDTIEMKMIIHYACGHSAGKFYGSAKERKEAVDKAKKLKETYGDLINSSAYARTRKKKDKGGMYNVADSEGEGDDDYPPTADVPKGYDGEHHYNQLC